jgi:hypothetical protein
MTDQQTRVAVGLGEGLPDVLNRLRKAAGTSVSLEIPAVSSLFLTASEFRALQATADRDGISVTVTTDDPLRQQLAALFKLPVAAPIAEPAPDGTESETVVPTTTPPLDGESVQETENTTEEIAHSKAPPSVVGRGRSSSRGSSPASVPVQPEKTTDDGQVPEPEAVGPSQVPSRLTRTADRIRVTTRRQRLIVAVSLVGIVVLAYLGAYLFLTRATVVLTLQRQAVSRDVSIVVAAPGATAPSADVTVAATPVSIAVTTTQTMNVTGAKTVGDATAQGKVSLSNPTGKPVRVDAGTQLQDKITGTMFAVVAAVEVPAGKNGAPGFGDAAVTCLQPGTVGNRDTGFLSGRLASGVYFSNRDGPIAGGTDKQIPVVAQTDLDTLQARAVDDLKAQAGKQTPGAGQVVLAPSIRLGQPSFTPNHQVGDESATLTIQASAQATALAYKPTELHDRVAAALTASAPGGFELDRSSLQLTDPVAGEGNAQAVRLTVRATGSATAIVPPETRTRIARAVAGGDEAAAKAYLATVAGIDGYVIRYSPGWLPHRIPSSAGRVRIETR